jgi:hypothetical protein
MITQPAFKVNGRIAPGSGHTLQISFRRASSIEQHNNLILLVDLPGGEFVLQIAGVPSGPAAFLNVRRSPDGSACAAHCGRLRSTRDGLSQPSPASAIARRQLTRSESGPLERRGSFCCRPPDSALRNRGRVHANENRCEESIAHHAAQRLDIEKIAVEG